MALGRELEQAITLQNEVALRGFKDVLKDSKVMARTQNRELKKISSKTILKQRLAQMYCLGNYKDKDIASILMVSVSTVKKMLRDTEVLDMINAYQDEEKETIDIKLKALRNKATDRLFELMDSEDDSIVLQATKDVLDRTGFKADANKNINVNVSYEQQIQGLIEGIDFTELIDVEVEDDN